jgi:hypothetical protein
VADARSEALRVALGLFTPAEREAQERRAEEIRQAAARQATMGCPLLEVEP